MTYCVKHVAQWIEHQIPILKVKGSIPFMLKILFIEIKTKFGADLVSTFRIN